MKKIIFTSVAIILALIWGNAQNTGYTPFHQYLQEGNTNFQQQNAAGRGIHFGEIAVRHDSWNAPSGTWLYSDSSQYNYNSQQLETGNAFFSYSTQAWNNFKKVAYTYDELGNTLTCIKQSWNNGTWGNNSNYTASYNASNKPLTETYQTAAGGDQTWLNTFNFIYSYNAANNLVSEVDQVWDISSTSWVNFQQNTQIYDSKNHLLIDLTQRWNAGTGGWDNYYQLVYNYDDNGNKISQLEQSWTQSWENYFQYNYSYDANHNVTLEITQKWDANSNSWVNQNKHAYAFDSGNNTTMFAGFNWDAGLSTWVPALLNSYSYNANNVKTTEIEQNWDPTSSSYLNAYKGVYSYDASNNNIKYEDFSWNISTNSWASYSTVANTFDDSNNNIFELDQAYSTTSQAYENTNQYFFYYKLSPATNISEAKNELMARLYPNPSTGNEVHLDLNLTRETELQLNTYDEQGRLISTETRPGVNGESNITLSYTGLSSGVFFIQLTDRFSGKQSTLKFLKD